MTHFYLLIRRYLFVVLALGTVSAFAQRSVSGRVTASEDGSGIPGVNILEKGTTNGTASDFDGNFSLSVGDNAVLVFSFIGYSTQEITVGAQSTINVSMELDVTALSEVVVIGYGEVNKRDITGSVASVQSEDFVKGIISSPEQLIQGKAAGVQVTGASGEPGAGVTIRIRGTSSVRGGNNPLFVVDGIPLSGADISAGGADLGRGTSSAKNPLNFLNPSDIESIDVLKDASATAIYGSRGANGVVIITTKSGKGKKKELEYSNLFSVSSQAKYYDLLDRNQFLSGLTALGSDASAQDFGANTDWQKEINRTSLSQRHDLSYGSNFGTGSYRASVSFDDQVGIIKNSEMQRITGRLNVNNKFADKLLTSAQLTVSRVDDSAAPIGDNAGFEGDLLGSTYMANPTWVADPKIQNSNTNANPLSYLEYSQDETDTWRYLINLSAAYDITTELNFKVNLGFDRSGSERAQMFSPDLFLSNGVFGNGRGAISEVDNKSDLLEAFFNYTKELGNSKLTALLGYSYQNFDRSGVTTLGWGFADSNMDNMGDNLRFSSAMIKDFLQAQPSQATKNYQQFGYSSTRFFVNSLVPQPRTSDLVSRLPDLNVNSVTQNRFEEFDELQSFYGRVNYDIADKYLFTATLRADGSTRFGGNNKYGYFPSAAAAWRLSDEDFIPEFFDDLKLRAGYGVTGNQEIPHNRHQQRQRFDGGISIQNGGEINPQSLNTVAFNNPDLKWEQTSQINFGLDFGFIEGRLNGSIDYYNKTTQDLLLQVNAAQPAPQPFVWTNLDADIVNSGVELTLNYIAIDNEKTGLDFSFNISNNTNEVKNFTGLVDTGNINGQGLTGAFAQRIVSGQPLYAYYIRDFVGYDTEGFNVFNGDFQQFVGKSPIPKQSFGFTTNFRRGNWDANIFFTGQFGHYVYNNTANAYFTAGSLANGRNVTVDVLTSGESPVNAPEVSTNFLEKGDFIRLQNLNVGYNWPMSNSFIKSLRISAGAQNLLLITDYSGLDPEINTNKARNDVPSLGIDYTPYPRARTFTLGLNATF